MLVLGALCVNIAAVPLKFSHTAAAPSNRRVILLSEKQGNIYDCNMKKLVNNSESYAAAVAPSEKAAAALGNFLSGEEYTNTIKTLSAGKPVILKINEPIEGITGIKTARITERRGEPFLLTHLIGYTDPAGRKGVAGLEKSWDELLRGNTGRLSAAYHADAAGRPIPGKESEIINEGYDTEAGIILTIDSEIQKIAEECIDSGGIDEGAVVILDAKTGKIRAMASRPNFNPNEIAAYLDDPASPLINRAITEYSVGSVFKLVVCAAALENGISPDFTNTCTGSTDVDGTKIFCHNHSGHGALDMKNGFALSCNPYFIALAKNLGAEKILKTAEKMGFGMTCELSPGLIGDSGYLPSPQDIVSSGDLANLSFGQGGLMATPLQIALAYLTVASGGNYYFPRLLEGVTDEKGNITRRFEAKPPAAVFSREINEKLKYLLQYSVEYGGGSLAKPKNSTAGGKTATAQTGWYKNGEEIFHAWFSGYFPADEPRYVITILKEEGRGGSVDCAPVFRKIAEGIEEYEALH